MINEMCFSDVLLESAKEVFEAMVFMPLDRASESDQKIEGCPLLDSITFKGAIDGYVAICCSSSCAKHILTNMLGMDPAGEVAEDEVFARKKAKALSIIPGKTRRAELTHSIQIEEGWTPCFGKFERPMCTYSLLLRTELPQNRVIK